MSTSSGLLHAYAGQWRASLAFVIPKGGMAVGLGLKAQAERPKAPSYTPGRGQLQPTARARLHKSAHDNSAALHADRGRHSLVWRMGP